MAARTPPTSTRLAMRADAQRNYQRLLAAASVTVAEQGAEASMEEIARRAGLGSTTLHRHFPTRQAMLEAVFQDRIESLCAKARELLTDPAPDAALITWLRAFVAHAATQRGLAAALTTADGGEEPPQDETCRTMIRAAGAKLLARAQQAGSVRRDLTIGTLLTLVNAIALITERRPDGAEQADQLLDVVIGGIHRETSTGRSPRAAHRQRPA
ncbi:TetR/AcrR family transcriptional regulator [Dactylosporangium fulvum]|uniref:TetR/AcrR family transcriptional regulator n=1 Tax=Dactylosporangium fulvum TaxID=53359 RepID=A0ABY5W9N0_9ACTN|nr:TetR/AcrR family transcriptional regulator [Dactylosporangium fulvum]UWP85724.1 TetR/AcrR family transcriptional regulator [Dactylosporangium fulvum]